MCYIHTDENEVAEGAWFLAHPSSHFAHGASMLNQSGGNRGSIAQRERSCANFW